MTVAEQFTFKAAAPFMPDVRAMLEEPTVFEPADFEQLTEQPDGQRELLPKMLSGSQKKTAFAIKQNAERMLNEDGLNCTIFLTITPGDYRRTKDSDPDGYSRVGKTGKWRFEKLQSHSEASRRLNNLNRRFLPSIFHRWILVTERHKDGGIHFHLLGTLKSGLDVRTGYVEKEVKLGDYRSVPVNLRAMWEVFRKSLADYGFGEYHEAKPVLSVGKALAEYVSKYIEKNICQRRPDDWRKKLVRYGGWDGSQLKPNNFGWGTPWAVAWRAKTRATAALIGVFEPEQAKEAFGPRWAFHLTQIWQKGEKFDVGSDNPVPRLCVWHDTRQILKQECERRAKSWCRFQEFQNRQDELAIGTERVILKYQELREFGDDELTTTQTNFHNSLSYN